MYIKVDKNGNILGHTFIPNEEYPIEINNSVLIELDNEDNLFNYKFKYDNSAKKLVALTAKEIDKHPLVVAKKTRKKLLALKEKYEKNRHIQDWKDISENENLTTAERSFITKEILVKLQEE